MAYKTTIEPMVLDIPEVAGALKVCVATVRNMIAAGELKSLKIRDRRFVRREHLVEYLDKQAVA